MGPVGPMFFLCRFLSHGQSVFGKTKVFFGTDTILEYPANSAILGIPSGIICMWSGAQNAIPDGWTLCNGSNGTPDLRDKFIVGSGSTYAVGTTGGEASHTLTVNEMPSHNHSGSATISGLTAASAGSHTHTISGSPSASMSGTTNRVMWSQVNDMGHHYPYTESAGAHTHSISGTGTATLTANGGGAAHNNLPPYYALCFIMKL